MKIIKENISIISNLIGKQNVNLDIVTRPIVYSVELPVKDGLLLYNTLTKCVVFVEEAEQNDVKVVDFLKNNWFLVPEKFDDKKFADQIRGLAKLFTKPKLGLSSYTILTTMECNARCFYCYEKNRAKMPMSDSVIGKVLQYIVRTHSENKIGLSWFGGEPLYNVKVIDRICSELIDKNIDFSSSIVSNGYLFDDEIIKRAKNIWKLSRAQITLDGTERVYNRSKSFIYKGVNAYKRVLDNIEKLVDNEIRVHIRLNVSLKNADDLLLLVDELKNKFCDNKYLFVYCHPLFEKNDTQFIMPFVNERKELFKKLRFIRNKISDLGLGFKDVYVQDNIKLISCMADNPNSVLILPDGRLGKCEHYSDNHFVGNIDDGICGIDEVNKFKEKMDDIAACETCPCYPDCYNLKLCETGNYCYSELQVDKIEKIKIRMLNTYNSYLKKQQINEDENNEIEIQC